MNEPVPSDGVLRDEGQQAVQSLLDIGRRAFRGVEAQLVDPPERKLKADDLRCRADLERLDDRERLVLGAAPASSLQLLALQLAINELSGYLLRDTPREIMEADVALAAAGVEQFDVTGSIRTLPERIRELAATARP